MSQQQISADRLGQALSGRSFRPPENAQVADSTPLLQAAPTDVSAAGMVLESQRPQSGAASEGVASAGLPPQPLMGEFVGEFVPAAAEATHSLAAGFQGETSGLQEGGTAYGFGETTAAGGPPAGTASVAAAAAHHGGYADLAQHAQQGTHPKRKMSEMGEVGDQSSPGMAAAAGGSRGVEEVQECDMEQASGGPNVGHSVESEGEGAGAGAEFNRVPSDVAMVLGDTPFGAPIPDLAADSGAGTLPDDCDSNMARAIQASLDDAWAQQAAQQAAAAARPVQPGAAGATGLQGARPSDADIIAYEEKIREEEVRVQPLVGDREPLDALAAEYAAGADIYRQKIDALKADYGSIRRTRGDGNCFFRSFLFGYVEHLLLGGDAAEAARVLARVEGMKAALAGVGGYQEIVLETPLEMVLSMLRSVGAPVDPLTIEGLETTVRDEELSGYLVWLLRMLTSTEIKARADFFAPFIMGLSDLDVRSFCDKWVDPMHEESDHVQLVALTDALQVPLRVVYLDRSLAPGGGGGPAGAAGAVHVDMHDFVPEGCPSPKPRVHLLYRPGHYDLLYPLREE